MFPHQAHHGSAAFLDAIGPNRTTLRWRGRGCRIPGRLLARRQTRPRLAGKLAGSVAASVVASVGASVAA